MLTGTIKRGILLLTAFIITLLTVLTVAAQDEATAEPEATPDTADMMLDEDMLAHGEYLAQIARCVACHTPQLEEFAAEELEIEQGVTLSLRGNDALDLEDNYLAGGRTFNLGPAGTFITGNLTPDEENGIGAWTDEELANAATPRCFAKRRSCRAFDADLCYLVSL